MATSNPTPPDENEHKRAFDLRDDILKKLSQAKGICEIIRTNDDATAITGAISDSLWAVDELLDDAKKAVKEIYQCAGKAVQS